MVQSTEAHDVQGSIEEGATRLLGIDGLAVVRVEREDSGARVVHVVTVDAAASACPDCGVLSASVRAWPAAGAGPAVRAGRGAPGVAQARLALPRASVPAADVTVTDYSWLIVRTI